MTTRIVLGPEFRQRYGIGPRTEYRWRQTGDGPPYVRLGPRKIGYRDVDLEQWDAERTFAHRAAEIARRGSPEK